MKLFIIIIIGLCNSFYLKTHDDPVYYVKITNTQTSMNIDRVKVTGYWFSKDIYCTLSDQRKQQQSKVNHTLKNLKEL